jgi:hypothetical protein
MHTEILVGKGEGRKPLEDIGMGEETDVEINFK